VIEPAAISVPVPSLSELAADPGLFDGLPRQVQDALFEQAAALEARLRVKVTVRTRGADERVPTEPDRAVRVDEAAALLGMTKDFLYRHWQKMGGYRDDDGHVKFAMSTLQRHVRRARR
jgi:hypothetical protein